MSKRSLNTRAHAARQLAAIFYQGQSFDSSSAPKSLASKDHAFYKQLIFTVLRHRETLEATLSQLLNKPLAKKEAQIHLLLLLGIAQLIILRMPDHAVLFETGQAAKQLGKPWATKLINGVLRNLLRQQAVLSKQLPELAHFNHPDWLLNRFQTAYPEQWQTICRANLEPGPMTLRVNQRMVSRDDYLQQLTQANIEARPCQYSRVGIELLQATAVQSLPGFENGTVSVQDQAGQLLPDLLALEPGMQVLDACAAPGSKSCHLLETCPEVKLDCLDSAADRLARLQENLARLQLNARVLCGDASTPANWAEPNKLYDRILIDAPCSATGVIRRHPDIKYLRKDTDITQLQNTQAKILHALWPLLKAGGRMIYSTCSVLPDENVETIRQFSESITSAQLVPIAADWGIDVSFGRQILPGEANMDGFFYAVIQKLA